MSLPPADLIRLRDLHQEWADKATDRGADDEARHHMDCARRLDDDAKIERRGRLRGAHRRTA